MYLINITQLHYKMLRIQTIHTKDAKQVHTDKRKEKHYIVTLLVAVKSLQIIESLLKYLHMNCQRLVCHSSALLTIRRGILKNFNMVQILKKRFENRPVP